jgi:hypothetical protein
MMGKHLHSGSQNSAIDLMETPDIDGLEKSHADDKEDRETSYGN